jgi:hypothetical protein
MNRAIEDVQAAEAELAGQLRKVGERHATEADVYHLSHVLARQCAHHLTELAPHAERYGASPAGADDEVDRSPGLRKRLRRKGAQALRGSGSTGPVFMEDLRGLYLAAQDAELTWTLLVQGAKALRDRELLDLATECQERAQMRAKWVRTRIKEAAPQILAAGHPLDQHRDVPRS